jgi:ubiquinone biosynthesis protein
LYVPKIYHSLTTKNMMVSERIYGIPINHVDTLDKHNINRKALAENGVKIFFTQVFRDCFFHADMHPGNIFVSYKNPKNPQYISIDCAVAGTLSLHDRTCLSKIILAFLNADYRSVAKLHIDAGWVPKTTHIDELEPAIRIMCEPVFEKPLADISFASVLMELFTIIQQFDISIQPQLVLLQKTLLNIEGLGRQLYPQLDIWSTAKPLMEEWLRDQYSFTRTFKAMKDQVPFWLEQMPNMPTLLHDGLHQLSHIEFHHAQTKAQLHQIEQHMLITQKQSSQRKKGYLMMALGGLISYQSPLFELPTYSGAILASAGLLWVLLKG